MAKNVVETLIRNHCMAGLDSVACAEAFAQHERRLEIAVVDDTTLQIKVHDKGDSPTYFDVKIYKVRSPVDP